MFAESVKESSAYPVCFAMAACCHRVEMQAAVCGYLFAMASAWILAAIRLNLIGQTAGQQLAGAIAPIAESIAYMAKGATLDDLGGCCFLNDIASFQHETQQARLFRS